MSAAEAYCEEYVVSAQYKVDDGAGHLAGTARGPERALMSALLYDGVITCMNYAGVNSRIGRKKFQEAFTWISTQGGEYIFSFDNICECLGLDSAALRRGIFRICSARNAESKKARRTF